MQAFNGILKVVLYKYLIKIIKMKKPQNLIILFTVTPTQLHNFC